MEWLWDPHIWFSLITLAVLEIVLGIDNLVFLAILSHRLPDKERPLAEKLGLGCALLTRLALLATIAWIAGLVTPVFQIFDHPVSWRDIILLGGGVFLIAKATHEIHGALEGEDGDETGAPRAAPKRLWTVVAQMAVIDIVFSLDSVITAVAMANSFWVMAAAIVLAMAVMLLAAAPLSSFIAGHPTVKMLALAFLIMIGMALVANGFGVEIPKGYLYFAMAFSAGVEALNLAARRRRKPKQKPLQLRHPLP